MPSTKFLENTVILCFERRFSKQNSVIRLRSSILHPPKFLGWLRHCTKTVKYSEKRKNNHLPKTKIILQPKYKVGFAVFTFSLPGGGRFAPLLPSVMSLITSIIRFKQEEDE